MKTLVFTGGHHTSGLEVAKKLKKLGWHIVWLGHRHSLSRDRSDSAEYLDVTASGIEFVNLVSGKIYRRFSFFSLLKFGYGLLQSFLILRRLKRESGLKGIVSFGGYLAVPVVMAGWLQKIGSVSHEQTVNAGWANKVIAMFAQKIMLSWPQSTPFYPRAKSVLTGLPLRKELVSYCQRPPQANQSTLKTVYITGGKQGSHAINTVVFSVISELCQKYKIIHQTGRSTQFNDHLRASAYHLKNYQTFTYDSKLGINALLTSDVVVSRAGAHICYELALLGKPCVLIPLPHSSHSEQEKNADVLVSAGQAIKLDQSLLNGASLQTAIKQALKLRPRKKFPVSTRGVDNVVKIIQDCFGDE